MCKETCGYVVAGIPIGMLVLLLLCIVATWIMELRHRWQMRRVIRLVASGKWKLETGGDSPWSTL